MTELLPWLSPIFAAAAIIISLVGNRSKAHGDRLAAIERRADVLEDRATKVESDMDHLPDKDVTHRLELTIGELRGEMRALTERIKPISAIADRIQDAVLDKVTHG